jgi:small subunit ribosomal protein S6
LPTVPRAYEAVYIFDSALEDAAITDKLSRFTGLLGTPADLTLDHWGRRQLAYPIGTKESGYYVVSRFSAESNVLPEYERALKLDDGVLRHLLTLHEHELGAPPMSEEELAKQNARRDDEDEDEE